MIIKVALSVTTPLGKKYHDQILEQYRALFAAMQPMVKETSGRHAYRQFGSLESKWAGKEHMALAIDETTDTLLGFIHFSYSNSGDRFLWIHNFFVAESERGKGTGKALMNWVQDYGRKKGCGWASLGVLDNNTDAQRLYASLGYITEAREMTLEL
jgi:GNAT superfamily N-acetyltransferase